MHRILAVANTMIKESDFSITNLKLNKLLYYAYGINLILGEDQIDEHPEAWNYGPVFPSVYQAFKKYANQTITDLKGHKLLDKDSFMYEIITATYEKYGHLNEFTLVDRTHANGTPWSRTYEPGMRNQTISDRLIKEYFKDKVVVNA